MSTQDGFQCVFSYPKIYTPKPTQMIELCDNVLEIRFEKIGEVLR